MAQSFNATYPIIARWVLAFGWIEMGQDEMSRSFVRALDGGVLVWEGQEDDATLDDAFQDLEAGLAAWMRKQWLCVKRWTQTIHLTHPLTSLTSLFSLAHGGPARFPPPGSSHVRGPSTR